MVVLVLLRLEKVLVAHLALAQVPVEVALVARAGAGVHLHDDVRQRAQQVAVVGDEHERTAVLLEELLQPVDGGQVEVVGRLVQEEEVRLGGQYAAQLGTHPPAARKARERLRELLDGEAEAAEGHLHARFEVVAAQMLERGLHLAVFVQHLRVAGIEAFLQGAHAGLQLVEAGDAAHRILQQRLLRRVRLGVLARGADARLALDDEFAVVRRQFAEDDLEERGLAGSVGPDDADAFGGVHAEADVRQHVLKAIVDRDVLKV